jgi:hypothetical protein
MDGPYAIAFSPLPICRLLYLASQKIAIDRIYDTYLKLQIPDIFYLLLPMLPFLRQVIGGDGEGAIPIKSRFYREEVCYRNLVSHQ